MMSIGGNVCFIEGGFGFRPSFIGLKNSDTPIIKMRTRAIVVEQLCWANPPSSSAFPENCELCDLTDFLSILVPTAMEITHEKVVWSVLTKQRVSLKGHMDIDTLKDIFLKPCDGKHSNTSLTFVGDPKPAIPFTLISWVASRFC